MATDYLALLDAFDRVAAAAEGFVSAESAAQAKARAGEFRARRGFHGHTLVLAIAGGTGTGKSSLLNAVARAPVASVSRIRPHTQEPLAWVPDARSPALDELLDALDVRVRAPQQRFPGLALVDLPDMDSLAAEHRRLVDALIPRVDGVVWVVDPSKYADPVLHEGFLTPLAAYDGHFVFVLNKIDTIGDEAAGEIAADLEARLVADGHAQPRLFRTAADPGGGEPQGIEAFERYLAAVVGAKRAAVGKWLIDISRELRRLGTEANVWQGASVDLESRWGRDRDAAAAAVIPTARPGSRFEALCRIEDLVAMIAVEAGPSTGEAVAQRIPPGLVETALGAAANEAARAHAAARRRRSEQAALESARRVLDVEIGRRLREALAGRARFAASITEAALAVSVAEAELDASGLSGSRSLAGGTAPHGASSVSA